MFDRCEAVRFAADQRPILLVVIDTEEEFGWGEGFSRDATAVTAMAQVGRFQSICDEFGVRPHYAIDYPVASQPAGFEPLLPILGEGRGEIGAHLHPWVNPPYVEEVNDRNSYAGNLDPALEREKISVLVETIETNLGVRPNAYKAGRYGLGPASTRTLEELGFDLDLSVCPRVDLGPDGGGPDYRSYSAAPFWFGTGRRLLELPATAEYVGFLHPVARSLAALLRSPIAAPLRMKGIFSRLGAFERIRLTPEGTAAAQLRRLARSLVRRGVPAMTFSFHSTSLAPGHTSYVRNDAELAAFLDACRDFFEFFLSELGGVAMTPTELRDQLRRGAGPSAANPQEDTEWRD